MIGAVVGFLWFNCHPAQVFMGDTGSLPLGGLLGLMAVVARQELLLVLVGGVFVAEAASVHPASRLVQVAEAADLPLRPAAPSFSISRLAGKQDRRPLLDRRGALRPVGHGLSENQRRPEAYGPRRRTHRRAGRSDEVRRTCVEGNLFHFKRMEYVLFG